MVTITDANGCNYQNTADLIAPPILSLSTAVTSNYNGADISCFGLDDGSASVTSSGGVQPHDILWDNSATSQNISNLSAGTYFVTITDKNGCISGPAVVTLNDPAALSVGLNIRDSLSYNVSCFGFCDGDAILDVCGECEGTENEAKY